MTNLDCQSILVDEDRVTDPPFDLDTPGAGTILLAEDDAPVREFIRSLLTQQGYRVLVASNGRESLKICHEFKQPIDALITDVVMPEMNGRELVEAALLTRPDLKVLFISGYVDRPIKEQVHSDRPAFAFLEKPFSADTLLNAVDTLCYKRA